LDGDRTSDDSLDETEAEDARPRRKLTRRNFIKWSAAAGAAAGLGGMGFLSASGIIKAPAEASPAWEFYSTDPKTGQQVLRVDYSKVPDYTVPKPGVSPPGTLYVAQWFDYWPGSFTQDFETYIKQTFGYDVHVLVSIYESNEELFEWITLGRQRFDVFFPSNYVVDLMKHGNLVYNLNTSWLPHFLTNVAVPGSQFVGVPPQDSFDMNAWGEFVSEPYFWGTTGVGFNTDFIPRKDVEANGFDLLWMASWKPSNSPSTLNLVKHMRMLDDERDVLGWGFKKAGWEEQLSKGLTDSLGSPTGIPNDPNPPWNGVYQWTTNETDSNRVNDCGQWLVAARPNLFDYNSTEDAASLASGASYLNQAWSGDIMYAKRPDQNSQLHVDYLIPKQGSTWWIDCAAIHSKSRNLWLAHQFLDFIHRIGDGDSDDPTNRWPENQTLTRWNLYSTPNQRCYDYFWNLEHDAQGNPTPIFPSGWIMTEEPILYPNKYDPAGFARCDISGDVGLLNLENLYNPLWFALTSV